MKHRMVLRFKETYNLSDSCLFFVQCKQARIPLFSDLWLMNNANEEGLAQMWALTQFFPLYFQGVHLELSTKILVSKKPKSV